MSTFYSRLGINDVIYFADSKGYAQSFIIREIKFSTSGIDYINHLGTHICYEHELDNKYTNPNFYFTSERERDEFLKTLSI